MSLRTERVASTLREAIQEVIARGLADPRLTGVLITITRVTVSEDLRSATAWVSCLPHDKAELALHGLRHASAHIRREAGERMALKQLPQLLFKGDAQLRREAEVADALAKLRREQEARGEAPDQGPDEDPFTSGPDTGGPRA